jgi:hypothetical protein
MTLFLVRSLADDHAGMAAFFGVLLGVWIVLAANEASDRWINREINKAIQETIRERQERSYEPYIAANKYEEAIAAYYKYNTEFNNNTQENNK